MHRKSQQFHLILASSSPYRAEMLERLGLTFECRSPDIDESANPGERVHELVARLARDKAQAIASAAPGSVTIGCDQLAHCEGRVLGKAGSRELACKQLASFSGRKVEFLSAMTVLHLETGREYSTIVPTLAHFRELESAEIERYVDLDRPWDCAGSFKSERAGSALLKSMTSADPTAIIGLPLIELSKMLRNLGFSVP